MRRPRNPSYLSANSSSRKSPTLISPPLGWERDLYVQVVDHARKTLKNPRQRECQRGRSAGQYSLGKWMTLLVKYRVISSSGKSVCSISFVNKILPLPSSHVSVAVRSGRTASFQT